MKTAYLFSGQGAQFEGMGRDLAEKYPEIKSFYDELAAILDAQPLDFTAEELKDTKYSQPATVSLSLAIWQMIPKASDYVLGGFSLGEYTAFGAADMLDTTALLKLVQKRADLMAASAETTPGCMCAVLGAKDEDVENLIKEKYENLVWPVNYNAPGQLVIAGHSEAVGQLAPTIPNAKRCIPLAVSGAFHTPMMQEAANLLTTYAQDLSVGVPSAPLYSNGTAEVMNEEAFRDFPTYLAYHMTHPVYWTRTIENMYAEGVRDFVEIGPGKTLKGLVGKILKGKDDVRITNIGTAEELDSVLNP